MYLHPDYSKRRANVISGLAAAFVAIGMIVVAGKARADQPPFASASAATAAAPTEHPTNPEAESKPPATGHANHANHDDASHPTTPVAKDPPKATTHDPDAHSSHD